MGQAVSNSLRHLLLLALLAIPTGAYSHRLDEYLQATILAIEPNEIRLDINLTPGTAVAERVLALIDRDHDDVISTNEANAYAESLMRDLIVRLDGRNIQLKVAALDFAEPADLRTGSGIIQMEFAATPRALEAGPHKLTMENRHLPAISVYLFNAARPASTSIRITGQKRNENQSTGEITFDFHPPANPSISVGIVVSLAAISVALFAGVRKVRKKATLLNFSVALAALGLLEACSTPSDQNVPVMRFVSTPLPGSSKDSKDYFTVGASMDEVASVMGTPASLDHSPNEVWWYYDDSRIVFRDGKVFSWDNYSNNLKVRWNPSTPVTSHSDAAPAPSISHPSPAQESPKPVPLTPETESHQIDSQVEALLSASHSPLPPMILVQADASASYAEIAVKNDTTRNLTLLFSGPTPRNTVILSNVTLRIVLAVGAYKVAATVDDSSSLPFAGTQEIHGGSYDETFRVGTAVK
jgi:outer membrane protein assembly factor BamE (lipoprotein component of BamABCDE complex)